MIGNRSAAKATILNINVDQTFEYTQFIADLDEMPKRTEI
jgi:hypothetical protein